RKLLAFMHHSLARRSGRWAIWRRLQEVCEPAWYRFRLDVSACISQLLDHSSQPPWQLALCQLAGRVVSVNYLHGAALQLSVPKARAAQPSSPRDLNCYYSFTFTTRPPQLPVRNNRGSTAQPPYPISL